MNYIKSAISAGRMIATAEADNPMKAFRGLVGLTITLLSGFCFPVLACLRHKFGERFFTLGRIMWGLFIQWLFFWVLKGIGFIWGIFYVGETLYKFFVIIDLAVLFHVVRIIWEMIWEKPQYSYSTGSPIFSPIWNIFKRAHWISDSTVRLILEPLAVFIVSLLVLRFGNPAIGSYLFMSSFALFQLESAIFRQRRAFYLDHKDSERIQTGHNSKAQTLLKPIPITHNATN